MKKLHSFQKLVSILAGDLAGALICDFVGYILLQHHLADKHFTAQHASDKHPTSV